MQSNVEINLFIYRELNPIEMLWVKFDFKQKNDQE